ncbi:hypothetical protein [Nannocystis radixulma]|uniref:Uncharacterized protein n=1 Tax=Nannocystis radixulma TaxID=2995305 RepID=A0ABT5BHU4_9BACT|nr:hypothetical protein [Nannocystis radixulma]MDC0672983.1 hypothetical protein [Nannocystis radixulma]
MVDHDSSKPMPTSEPIRAETVEPTSRVPLFARKLDRPTLVVRTGIQAGPAEAKHKAP